MATADVMTKPGFERVKIADIQVGSRYRKALGDLESFASSIRKDGLLHPIVVDESLKLIAGYRRLVACRDKLRWETIPVHIVPLQDLVWGEYTENAFRQDYLPSEMAAISKALNIGQRQEARQRQAKAGPQTGKGRKRSGSGKLPQAVRGRAKDRIAKALGTSRRTLEKAEDVVEAAEENPELQPLVEEMDTTGNVDAAYKKLQETTEPARPKAPEPIEIDLRPRNLPDRLGMTSEELLGAGAAITTLIACANMTVDEFLGFTKNKLPDIEPVFREAGCSGSDEVIKVTVRKIGKNDEPKLPDAGNVEAPAPGQETPQEEAERVSSDSRWSDLGRDALNALECDEILQLNS